MTLQYSLVPQFIIELILDFGFIAIILIFAVSTTFSYRKNRAKIALYLSLSYYAYSIFVSLIIAGRISVIFTNGVTTLYDNILVFGQIFVIMGMILFILFYDQFSKLKKSLKIISIFIGLFIILWFLLPFNYTPKTGRFHVKYISFTFETIYGIAIYLFISIMFIRAYEKSLEKKKEIIALITGNLLWILYFFIKILQVFIPHNALLSSLSQLVFISIIISYFLGIYYPKLVERRKTK